MSLTSHWQAGCLPLALPGKVLSSMVFINTYKKRKIAPGCLCIILKGWGSPMRWCWEDGDRGHLSSVCLPLDSFLSSSLGPVARGKGMSVFILLPAIAQLAQETQERRDRSLSWQDPLEEEMASHFSMLAGKTSHLQRSLEGYTVHWVTKSRKTKLAHTHHCSVLEGGLPVFEGRAQKRKDLLIQR